MNKTEKLIETNTHLCSFAKISKSFDDNESFKFSFQMDFKHFR